MLGRDVGRHGAGETFFPPCEKPVVIRGNMGARIEQHCPRHSTGPNPLSPWPGGTLPLEALPEGEPVLLLPVTQ